MLLHLVPDHNFQFIDAAINSFESVYPNKNKFLVGTKDNEHKLNFKNQKVQVFIASYGSEEYYKYIGDITKYEAVLLHYLDKPKLKILHESQGDVNFVWISWGADIYSRLPQFKYPLFGSEEKKVIAKIKSNSVIEYIVRNSFLFDVVLNLWTRAKLAKFNKILRRIKYYSTIIPFEKEIVEKYFKINAKYVRFNYGSNINHNQNKINNLTNYPAETNILLGNSGAVTNNHIEIIKVLSKINLSYKKVITPLNYGGNKEYIKYIITFGTEKLGDNFVPLQKFLDKSEYFNIISTCSFCIMNHFRQQAMGNNIFMLSNGAKVFLSEKNPVYYYFKDMGIIIFSIEHDLLGSNNEDVFNELPFHSKDNNRKIIEKEFGAEAILERTRNFVNTILGKI